MAGIARTPSLQAFERIVRSTVVGASPERRTQNQLISDVEKLVSDYRRGDEVRSRSTIQELGERSSASNSLLSRTDPRAASLYNSVSTFLSYDQKARFVSALSTATDNSLSRPVNLTA